MTEPTARFPPSGADSSTPTRRWPTSARPRGTSSSRLGAGQLGLAACLILHCLSAAAQVDLPTTDELRASEAAFELLPGVIADPAAEALYLMSPEGGIDKLSLSSGELLWSTADAAKPLALYGDLLLAQAEGPGADLEIVLLDADRGGDRLLTFALSLPAGVLPAVDDGMGRSFLARAAVRDGQPLASWESVRRRVEGVAPGPDEELEKRHAAAYRLDPATRGGARLAETAIPAPTLTLPPALSGWADAGVGRSEIARAGGLLAATELTGGPGSPRIVLKRWHAESGQALPEVELFRRPHVLQLRSADGRHLLVAERAAPGEVEEYEWSIFSLETGERVGQVSHHQSHGRFFVAGDILVYESRRYSRRAARELIHEPRRLRAVLLDSGAEVWRRALRETAYRGPYPP